MEQLINTAKALGIALKRQRKAMKLSQGDLGNLFKIEQSTVSSIESGAPGTRLETLFRVLAALDLELIVRDRNISNAKTYKIKDEGW